MVEMSSQTASHFRDHTSFVDRLAELETSSDRLRHIDNTLRAKLLELAEENVHRRVMFFELDLSAEEYSLIIAELSAYFAAGRKVENLFISYPRVVLGALVGAAMQSTREGVLWPTFWQLMGCEPMPEFERGIRGDARMLLEANHLESFRLAQLGANTYVSLFLLHAGLTSSQVVDIVTFAQDRGWHAKIDDTVDIGRRVLALTTAIRVAELDRESLSELVTYVPELSQDLFARLLELISYLSQVGYDPSFEGTNGLPSLAFDALVNLLEKGQVGEAKTRQKQPSVVYDPGSNSLVLELPPVPSTDCAVPTLWDIQVKLLSGESQQQQAPAAVGHDELQRIALGQPFSQVRVRLDHPGLEERIILGPSPDRPFYFISGGHRLVSPRGGLAAAQYRILAPRGTYVRDIDGEDLCKYSRAVHPDWDDWESFIVDLRESVSFQVETPAGEVFTYAVGSAKLFEWLTNVAVVPNILSKDAQPVYSESPQLRLRGEEGDQWAIQGVYEPLDDEPVHMFTMEVEQADSVAMIDVFPFDEFEDPWVGRFGVTLYRNGVVQDSMLFNILERVDLRSSSSAFRFMNHNGKYSAWSYTFVNESGKKMELPMQTKTLPSSKPKAQVQVSAAGYSLTVDVAPPTLWVRYKNDGMPPVETMNVPTLVVDQLDPDAAVRVQAPEKLPLARFVLVGNNHEVVELEQAESRSRGSRTLHIANSALDSAMGESESGILMLVWSRMSQDEFENSLSDVERKTYFRSNREEREERYRESAHHAFVSARVGRLIRRPLVEEVKLSGPQLVVTQPQGFDRDIFGWVWALGDPGRSPGALVSDDAHFRLPSDFVDIGPLLVDFREETFLCDTTAPDVPTASAVLVEQQGTPVRGDEDWTAMMYNLGYLDDPRFHDRNVLPRMKEMWRLAYLLKNLRNTRSTSEYFSRAVAAMRLQPRAALDALNGGVVPRTQMLSLLVQTGLIVESMATAETGGAPHDEPVFSVLEEITDCVYLRRTAPMEEELKESMRWVTAYGSPELLRALTEGVDAGTVQREDTRRSLAVREALERSDRFHRLGTVLQLNEVASALGEELAKAGVDNTNASLVAATLKQQARDDDRPAHKLSRFVPYISYITMLAARFVANTEMQENKRLQRCKQLLLQNRYELARLIRCAPEMFEEDLLMAEALSQHKPFVRDRY